MSGQTVEELRALLLSELWLRPERLIELAPMLPESMARHMLSCAPSMHEDAVLHVQILAALALRLPGAEPEALLRHLMEEVGRPVGDPVARAQALAALLLYLPESERPTARDEALGEALAIPNGEGQARALEALLPHLAPAQQEGAVRAALQAAQAIADEESRAAALAGLTAHVTPPLRQQALASARTIGDPEARARGLSALAQLAQPLRTDGLQDALDAAQGISVPYWRARALVALAQQIPQPLQSDARLAARLAAQSIPDRSSRGAALAGLPSELQTDQHLQELLSRVPSTERDVILGDWCHRLWERCAHGESTRGLDREPPPPPVDVPKGPTTQPATRERVVNTYFAPRAEPEQALQTTMPLAAGQPYYFELEVGWLDPRSIETTPTPLPLDKLPKEALLSVALFTFPGEIVLIPGADVGHLRLQKDGSAVVEGPQPEAPASIPPGSAILKQRLFFPVRAPIKDGVSRLRCNIYCQQVLVQSRLIQGRVMPRPQAEPGALRSDLDYTLSERLVPGHLVRLQPHLLSLMLNSNGDGTHTFIFNGGKGQELFKNTSVISASELEQPVENARNALRKASWGDENAWAEQGYRYMPRKPGEKLDLDVLRTDLINLAIRGWLLYDAIIGKLTQKVGAEADKLMELMREPGRVQIALRQSATQYVPAALFYDYPLDTGRKHTLCDAFVSALDSARPLEDCACFQGRCPHREDDAYVCPSGFWGYRHRLGMPVSLPPGAEVSPEIVLEGAPQITVGVATNLEQVDAHMQALQALRPDLGWNYGEDRDTILQRLQEARSHVVYFYCHGGVGAGDVPYLQVGSGNDYIEGSVLRAKRIAWTQPHPLIFINGCHTTALGPKETYNLVQAFVERGGAGVIGTDVTIFEPLACDFALGFLRRFLAGVPADEAVRTTRLELLKTGNPLGLVYTPFVLAGLALTHKRT